MPSISHDGAELVCELYRILDRHTLDEQRLRIQDIRVLGNGVLLVLGVELLELLEYRVGSVDLQYLRSLCGVSLLVRHCGNKTNA